jgi:hypothetical protein
MIGIGNSAAFKRLSAFLIIICGGLFVLSSVVLKPLYIFFISDVVWSGTFLVNLLEVTLDLFELLAYSTSFAVVIYSVLLSDDARGVKVLIAEFMLLAFVRRILDIVMTIVIYGALEAIDIVSVLFALAMEFIQIFIVYIIAVSLLKKEIIAFLPAKKIYSKKNALQVSALCAGGILSAVKIVSRIIYDIDYGAPESLIEVCSMVLFYSLDVLVAIISYVIIIVVLAMICRVNPFERSR